MHKNHFNKLKNHIWVLLILSIYAAHLVINLYFQFLDADEGAYLMTSKLATEGYLLYKDYFTSQMPLFFYFYGYFMQIFGFKIEIARCLSALWLFLGALSCYGITLKLHKNDPNKHIFCFLLLILYTMNINFFSTSINVKHYAPALGSLLVGLYFLASWLTNSNKKTYLFMAIFFISMSTNIRAFMIISNAPIVLWVAYLVLRTEKKLLSRKILILISALLLPAMPTFYFLIKYPEHLIFSVFTAVNKYLAPQFHTSLLDRIHMLISYTLEDKQYLIMSLFIAIGVLFFLFNIKKIIKNPSLASQFYAITTFSGFCLGATYLKLSPSFWYINWVYLTPFYFFAFCGSFYILLHSYKKTKQLMLFLITSYALIFLTKGVFVEKRYDLPEYGNHDVPLREQSPWTYIIYNHRDYNNGNTYRSLANVNRVAEFLKPRTNDTEEILAWLNSPLTIANRKPAKGFEAGVGMNELFWKSSFSITEEDSFKFNIATKNNIIGRIEKKEFQAIVVDPYTEKDIIPIIKTHYTLVQSFSQYHIYLR